MTEYKIINDMKIQGKSLVILDHRQSLDDMSKSKVVIDGVAYDYLLMHGFGESIAIDTLDDLNGKMIHFE